jgi:outer membrane protein assembly factor BamD
MRKFHGLMLATGLLLLLSSCKTEFERVRTSGDPAVTLKKAFEYYEKEEWQRSQTLFELVINNVRGLPDAEKAYFYYAYTHYHLGQYVLSAYYFKTFANTYTASPFREEAAFMSAYSNYRQSPSFRLDQGPTGQAIEEFQTFVNLFPTSKRVAEANRLIDEMRRKLEEKAFAEGKLYYDMRQFQSALLSFDNLLRDYPETPDEERVRYLVAKSSFLLAENSVVEKKEERFGDAVVRSNDFLEKYPNGKYADEVKDMRRKAEIEQQAVRKRLKAKV